MARHRGHQRAQVGLGDPQALLDLLGRAAPDRVLVLDRQHAVEAALVERVDVAAEVDVAEAGDAVAPPAHVPRVLLAGRRPPEEAVAVALLRERLGVLGVRVRDAVDVGPQRAHRVDAEPQQVRRVEVQVQPELEHPLPQLGRVGEVAGVAVGVPALHHAVLDHQLHAALAGVVDERREDALGLAQVLGDRAAGVAADERADRRPAERRRGVDARAQVRVDRLAHRRVGMQVVVVVGERRERQAVAVERGAHALGLRPVEGLGGEVARDERAVALARPGRELERLVAVRAGPGRDVLERPLGHARGEEAELHEGTSRGSDVDPALLAGRGEHGVGDLRRAQAVGEAGKPVGRVPVAIAAKTSATNRSKQSW